MRSEWELFARSLQVIIFIIFVIKVYLGYVEFVSC